MARHGGIRWYVETVNGLRDVRRVLIKHRISERATTVIATVEPNVDGHDDRLADAYLLAAAPELLAELWRARTMTEELHTMLWAQTPGIHKPLLECSCEQALAWRSQVAAIARAEGRLS